jgi:hypothetical protein
MLEEAEVDAVVVVLYQVSKRRFFQQNSKDIRRRGSGLSSGRCGSTRNRSVIVRYRDCAVLAHGIASLRHDVVIDKLYPAASIVHKAILSTEKVGHSRGYLASRHSSSIKHAL